MNKYKASDIKVSIDGVDVDRDDFEPSALEEWWAKFSNPKWIKGPYFTNRAQRRKNGER